MGIVSKVRGRALSGATPVLSDSGDAIQVASRTLTATQVKALNTTPLVIASAPGANKCSVVLEVFAKYVFGTTAYTGSNALEFRYTSSNGAKASSDVNANLLLSGSGTNYRVAKGADAAATLIPVVNAPIVVYVPSANPAQGDGALTLKVYYRTIA